MTTETAVTVANTQAMATSQEPFDNGLGELDAGDLIIPRLSITQPTTPDIDAAQIGKLCVNITGDYQDTMRVVVIKLNKSRILFPETYKRDNDPLCRSHDFAKPANDIQGQAPMEHTCGLLPGEKKKHVCPYANWTVNDKHEDVPPRCQESWNLLIVDLDSYMPMWFTVKSTALKPLRKIVSAISMISNAKRLPMWHLGFGLSIEKVTNNSGTFYVPVFSGLSAITAEDALNMDAIRKQLVNVDIKDAAEPDRPDAPPSPVTQDDEDF